MFLLDRSVLVLDATVDERRQGRRGVLGGSRVLGDGEVLEQVVQNLQGLGVLLGGHLDVWFRFLFSL